VIIEQEGDGWNRARCTEIVLARASDPGCKIEVLPSVICLDADGGSGIPGVNPTGGFIVTVGGSSGDFKINSDDGAAGAGGLREEAGAGDGEGP
jgi:hypothetical protein